MAIYLDYASTTPTSKCVLKSMQKFWSNDFYNPSAIYPEGRKVAIEIKKAREKCAGFLDCRADNIVFTSGGTESANMAVLGVINACKLDKPHVVATMFEHPAVSETLKLLESTGQIEVSWVKPEEITGAIKPETVLVTVIYVNNEIGSVQPVREIGKFIKKYRHDHNTIYPYLYTDACQAIYLPINQETMNYDLLTLDGSKIYGPKGVGLLYIRDNVKVSPISNGGGQEAGKRPGTEPVPLVVGLGEALVEAKATKDKEFKRLKELKNYFIELLNASKINYSINGDIDKSSPHIINICIPGISSEFAVIALGEKGVMCSAGASCSNLELKMSSRSVSAIGKTECAESSIRFSFGRATSKGEIKKVVKTLLEFVG